MDNDTQVIDQTIQSLKRNIKNLKFLKEKIRSKSKGSDEEYGEIDLNRRVFLFENGSASVPKVVPGKDLISKLDNLDRVFHEDIDESDSEVVSELHNNTKLYF